MPITDNKLSTDLALVFRALPGLYMLLSPDFIIQNATELYARTANLIIDEVIGKSIFDIYPDNQSEPNEAANNNLSVSLRHVISLKEPHTIPVIRYNVLQVTLESSNFEERYWKINNTPVLNSNEDLTYIIHEVEDITEAVLQEQINQQNQERLAVPTNALHTVAWEYDILNDKLSWNDSLLDVFGYAPDEMETSGKSWDKLVHPNDFERVQQSIAHATSSGQKIWTGEYRLRKADGSYAHVLDQGYFLYDGVGYPLRTFGIIIDISLSKQSEEELREGDARFRQLLKNLPLMAWIADSNGKISFFNESWYNYTGMARGQTDGWAGYVHPEDTADVITSWHEAISSGNLYETEYRVRDCMNGTYRSFLERGVPMHDEKGNITLWVGTYTDIEDQKQTLEKIRRDQQLEDILKLSPVHLCLFEGPNHICRYVSPGVYNMYGNRTYIGKPACEIWPEFVEPGFISLLDQVYSQGNSSQLDELQVMFDRHQNGKPDEAYFNFKYQPTFNNYGQIECVLVTATEVTELVQVKHKAEELAAKLKEK